MVVAATVMVVARAAAVTVGSVGALAVMAEAATVEAKAGVVRAVGRAAASVAAMVPHLSPCHRVRQVVAARTGATRAGAAGAAVASARAVGSAAAGVEAAQEGERLVRAVVAVEVRADMVMEAVDRAVACLALAWHRNSCRRSLRPIRSPYHQPSQRASTAARAA